MAPRDGTAIVEKTARIVGFFDFSSLWIPPKTPLLKGGCCQILPDVGGRQLIFMCVVTAAFGASKLSRSGARSYRFVMTTKRNHHQRAPGIVESRSCNRSAPKSPPPSGRWKRRAFEIQGLQDHLVPLAKRRLHRVRISRDFGRSRARRRRIRTALVSLTNAR